MKLAETQQLFWRALQGDAVDAATCFAGTTDLPAAERVEIYVDMYVARLLSVLREDFPETCEALGHEEFFALARRYLKANPSQDPDVARVGRGFAEFCPDSLQPLALREWARSEVFVEAASASLSAEQFAASIDPATFADLRLTLVPALRLAGAWAVWRVGYEVKEIELSQEEARALALALEGAALGPICAAFSAPEAAFAALQSWVGEGWVKALG